MQRPAPKSPKLPSPAEIVKLMHDESIPQSSRDVIFTTYKQATLAINQEQKNMFTKLCVDMIETTNKLRQEWDERQYHLGVATFKDYLSKTNQDINEALKYFSEAVEDGVLAAHYWLARIYIEMMKAVEDEKKKAALKNMVHNSLLIIAKNIQDEKILNLLMPTEKISLYEMLEKYKKEAREKVSCYYQAAEYIRNDILYSSNDISLLPNESSTEAPEENKAKEPPHTNQSQFYLIGVDYAQKYLASGDNECMRNAFAGLEVANDMGTIDAAYWMLKLHRHILIFGSKKEKENSIRKIKILLNQLAKNIKYDDKIAYLSEEEKFSFIKIIKSEYDNNDKIDEEYLSTLKYCLNHLTYTCVTQNPMSAEANYLRGQYLTLCDATMISILDYYCSALMLGSRQALDAMIEVLKSAKRLNINEKKLLNHLINIKELFSRHHYVDSPFIQNWKILINQLEKTYGTVNNHYKQKIFDKNKFKLQLAFYLVKQPYRVNSNTYDLDAIFSSVELTSDIDAHKYRDIFDAISSEMSLVAKESATVAPERVIETQAVQKKPKTKKVKQAIVAPLKRAKHANNEKPLKVLPPPKEIKELEKLIQTTFKPAQACEKDSPISAHPLPHETLALKEYLQLASANPMKAHEPDKLLVIKPNPHQEIKKNKFDIVGKIDIPENIRSILSELADGYLVGSQVRRRLMGESGPRLDKIDYDLVTSAPKPSTETVIIAGEKFIRNPANHRLFKHEKLKIEIFYSKKLAISLEADADSRDFTNTFYANLHGFVVTPIKGAVADLYAGIIRTIKPWYESFSASPIHILRYIKFLNEGYTGLYSPHEIQQVLNFLEDKDKINDEQIFYYLARILMDGKAVSGLDKLVEFGVYQKILGCIDSDLIDDLRKTLAKTDRQFAERHSLSWPRVFSLFVMAHIIDDLHQDIISYQSFLNPGLDEQYQAAQDYIESAMLSMHYPQDLIDAIMGRDEDDSKNINTQYIRHIITAAKKDKAYHRHQAKKQSSYSPLLFQSVSLRDDNEEDEMVCQQIGDIPEKNRFYKNQI